LGAADVCGANSGFMRSHNLQCALCVLAGDKRNESSFARDVQRIQPQYLAGGVDVFADRKMFFLDADSQFGGVRDFIQRTGQAAAGEIAKAMDFHA